MTHIDPRTLHTGCTLIKNLMAEKQEKRIWLVVWNMGIFIPTDELIFFRGAGIPPTRLYRVHRWCRYTGMVQIIVCHWSTSQHSWTSTLISLDPVPIKEPSKTGSDSGLTCSIFCPYCLYCNYCCYCFNNKVFKLLIPEFAVSREGIHLWDRRRIYYGYKLYIYIYNI